MSDKKMKSLVEEISSFVPKRNASSFVEVQADHVIHAAIRLLEMVDTTYDNELAEKIEKRLFLAIKTRNPKKFANTMRQIKESSDE